MLYGEFLEGTGCRDNDHNYQLYKRLELMYMADDSISKQEIYEYGKKLADNSKSPEQLAFEEEINTQIVEYKSSIADYKKSMEQELQFIHPNKGYIKYCKEQMVYYRRKVKECKWILGGQQA